ncbi:MAG TPA: coenzyme F420-0:L-glutamate ligase [Terriglobales bacterium]|jgi:coenzyme F420-0:L-glutamate ligase/coenzyme F420-1:gamma-L-glutamate ligase
MPRSCEIRLFPIALDGAIVPGDDLAEKLAAALRHQRLKLTSGDIVVVKHKIVSKAEGNVAPLSRVRVSRAAKSWARSSGTDARVVQLALSEGRRVVRKKNGVLITQTRHGFVCANSGVDVSNVDGGASAVLLPRDPDASAAKLRSRLKKLCAAEVAVIISDSFGRPWREGLTEVAIGVAGMKPLIDYRGRKDAHGYKLHATAEAVADEIACAAGLVCGKLNRTPVCIVRGFPFHAGRGTARELIRPAKNDLFR